MSKFKKSIALSGTIEAWHCGRDLRGGIFSLEFLRSGEGINYLGPGVYFANDKELALRYAKYVDKAFIYKCSFPADGLYDSDKGEPINLRDKIIELNEILTKDFGKKYISPTSSFKYGKNTIGFLHEKFGREKALNILKDIGINGAYEQLPGGVVEYCMFDTSQIKIIAKEPVGDHTEEEKLQEVIAPLSKAKVIEWYDGVYYDFEEYSFKFFNERTALIAEPQYDDFPLLTNFDLVDKLAAEIMAENPNTVILHDKDGTWQIGKFITHKKAQVRRNYDYGEGIYSNLDKYKSVEDFRKKRRAKRKKDIKNILDSKPDKYKAKK